jgi:bifunctional non-homologous end joining protein LigD
LHFDLRLELDGVFRSWAIAKRPSLDPAVKRLAVEVEDHPLDYGDFEGVIPEEAYGGGTVMIWDSGTWASDDEDARRALAKGELKFHLNGEKLRGDWALVRMKNNQKRYGKSNWLLIKRRDGFARQEQEADDVEGRSAASGRTMAEIADRPLDRPAAKTAPARKPSRSKPAKKPAADSQPAIVMGVAISHPERQLWPPFNAAPAVSKLDLARYLEWAGPSMIDHIEGRPCAILRAPEGIARSSFFQRHAIAGMSGLVKLINVPGEERPFLRIDTVESLIMLAQFGAIEFHPSNCKPGNPMRPGRLVFDLDPGPSVEFSTTIAAAKELRDRLNKLGLIAFCKTSGGKGLHVVTPLKATTNSNAGWTEARSLAETICRQMAADSPDLYVIGMAKRIRKGRIFLDFLRNDLMASSVAPFSPRARPAATVSMPLSWSQLRNDLNPTRYTIHTVPKLIKRTSAWKDYADAERPLAPALKRLRTTA